MPISCAIRTAIFGFAAAVSVIASAATPETLKPGTWNINYYPDGSGSTASSSLSLCVGGQGWSLNGPLLVGRSASGGWNIVGDTVYFYGILTSSALNPIRVGSNIKTGSSAVTTISDIGNFVNSGLITGRFIHFEPSAPETSVEYGTYEAVYEGPVCAL